MIRFVLLGALLLLTGGQGRSQDHPASVPAVPVAWAASTEDAPVLEVTTDSRAYCQTLSRQIETYRSLPREVRELQLEGRTLCSEGHVRGGINRLRRALMVMRAPPEDRQNINK